MRKFSVLLGSVALGTSLASCTVFDYDQNGSQGDEIATELNKRCNGSDKANTHETYNEVAVLYEPCDPCKEFALKTLNRNTACIDNEIVVCQKDSAGKWVWQESLECASGQVCATIPNTNHADCFDACTEDTVDCKTIDSYFDISKNATFSYTNKCVTSKEGKSISILDPGSIKICADGATCAPKTGCSSVAYQLSGPAYTTCGANDDLYEMSIHEEIIRYDNCHRLDDKDNGKSRCAIYQGVARCVFDCQEKDVNTTQGICGGKYNIMSGPQTCVKLDDGSYGKIDNFLTKCSSCSHKKCQVEEEDKGLNLPLFATCDMYLTFPHCEGNTLFYCDYGVMASEHCEFSCTTNDLGYGWCDGIEYGRFEPRN